MYRKVKLTKPKDTVGKTSQGDGKPWGLVHWLETNVLARQSLYRTQVDLEHVVSIASLIEEAKVLEERLLTEPGPLYLYLTQGQWEWLKDRVEPDQQFSPGGIAPRHQVHLAKMLREVHAADQISETEYTAEVAKQKGDAASTNETD